MANVINPRERIIEELFRETPEQERCPFIRKDEVSPYCAKNLKKDSEISEQRRMICDIASLQFWCSNKQGCYKCIFYQGEPID